MEILTFCLALIDAGANVCFVSLVPFRENLLFNRFVEKLAGRFDAETLLNQWHANQPGSTIIRTRKKNREALNHRKQQI